MNKKEEKLLKQIFGYSNKCSKKPNHPLINKSFKIKWCDTCQGIYVECPRCKNNSCNAGTGENGKCPVCGIAYKLQKIIEEVFA